jgi:5,10-methylenetetrahydromethanopterin reductase
VGAPRLGLGFLGFPDLRAMTEAGVRAEEKGFESAWVSETRITRDAVTGMTALLMATHTMRVGSAAINVFTRGAALVAVTWATLAETAPGRVVLGLGGGSAVPLAQQGLPHDHTVSRMREFTEAVRGAWAAPAPFSYAGRYVQFEGLEPEVRPTQPPPIYFCVAGPRALVCAAEVADGVVFDSFLAPAYVESARAALHAAAPGGSYGGELAGVLMVSIQPSVAEAAVPLRPILANYLINFPELATVTGIDVELVTRMREVMVGGGLEPAAALLGDDLIARHSLCGPPKAIRERLGEYRAAGLQLPVLFPVRSSLDATIADLAGS